MPDFAVGVKKTIRSSTFVVAASNSNNTSNADYRGGDIASALAALPANGGSIILLDGTFALGGTLSRAIDDVSIIGQGANTIVNLDAGTAVITVGAQDGWYLANFQTDAGGLSHASATNLTIHSVWENGTVGSTMGGDIIVADGTGLIVGNATGVTVQAPGDGSALAEFQVLGTTRTDSTATIGNWRAGALGPNLVFAKSRNATIGSFSVVSDGDDLGTISWDGDDGTDYLSEAARIRAEVDGTPGTGDMPGRLLFSTTADGAETATERVRISADGTTSFNDNDITNVGGVVIGHTVQIVAGGETSELQVLGTSASDSSVLIYRGQADQAGPVLRFGKGRDAIGTFTTVVADNDDLGNIIFVGADTGDAATVGAEIRVEVDGGTPGANRIPGRISFLTSEDNTSAPVQALRLDSSQNATFGGDVSVGDNNITNVGDIALDSISADGTNVSIDAAAGSAIRLNDAQADVDVVMEASSGSNDTIFQMNSGLGAFGVGSGADGHYFMKVNPTFVSDGGSDEAVAFYLGGTLTGHSEDDERVAAMRITTNITTAGNATHVASLYVDEPQITVGAGTVTNASTVYIAEAPDQGTNRYALFVDDGTSRFDGQILATDGNAGAPGYGFSGDTDTGIYRNGANAVTIATGGSAALRIDASQNTDLLSNDLLNVGAADSEWTRDAITLKGSTTAQIITVGPTSGDNAAIVRVVVPSGADGDAAFQMREGDGTGSADNMQYTWRYEGDDNMLVLQSDDTDGSATNADIIRIPDGQLTVDFNSTTDESAFDDYDDAMVLRRAFSPEYRGGRDLMRKNRQELIDMGVLRQYDDGFVGYSDQRMAALLAGGIYQTRGLVDEQADIIAELNKRIAALEAR